MSLIRIFGKKQVVVHTNTVGSWAALISLPAPSARHWVGRVADLLPEEEVIDILRQRSRPYLFSNTLAPSIVGASIAVLDCWV